MKTILFSVLLMACGGGGKSKPATPTDPTPTPTETTAKEGPKETPPETKPEPKKEEPPPPDPDQGKKDALAAEMTAFEKAKPIFEGSCKACHLKGQKTATAKKLGDFDITTYPFGGKHNSTKEIRTVLAIGGGKATMPKSKPGSVKGDDLAAIAAWADAYDAAETAGAHEKK